MHGYLVEPFLITSVLAIFFVLLMPQFGRLFGSKKSWPFVPSILIAAVLFIPGCNGVMTILDKYRYGTFSYNNTMEISDRRIRHWMPQMATSITVYKTWHGHLARFGINKAELSQWLTEIRKEYEPQEVVSNKFDSSEFAETFEEVGWAYPEDSVAYYVTLSSNGAGFTIWFSDSLKVAYLSAGYW